LPTSNAHPITRREVGSSASAFLEYICVHWRLFATEFSGSLTESVGTMEKKTILDRLDRRRKGICMRGSGRFGREATHRGELSNSRILGLIHRVLRSPLARIVLRPSSLSRTQPLRGGFLPTPNVREPIFSPQPLFDIFRWAQPSLGNPRDDVDRYILERGGVIGTMRKLHKVSDKPASTLGFSMPSVVSKEPHPLSNTPESDSRQLPRGDGLSPEAVNLHDRSKPSTADRAGDPVPGDLRTSAIFGLGGTHRVLRRRLHPEARQAR